MIRMALLLTAAATAFAVVDAEQAAPTSPDNTPFYQGITDEASLTRVVEGRLARAQQLLDRLVAAKGKRTVENTLRLYDDLQTEILNADGPNENAQMLHPDAKVIATAERLAQRITAPSQMLEEWVFDPHVMARIARHQETGAPIPASLVQLRRRVIEVGRGGDVRQSLLGGNLALSLHERDPKNIDPIEVYREIAKGLPSGQTS